MLTPDVITQSKVVQVNKNLIIALLPCVFVLLAIPPLESLSDLPYFYGSVLGVLVALIFGVEHVYITTTCAVLSIPILFMPIIYKRIKGNSPKCTWYFARVFAILNGGMGFLITWGKWY